MPRTRISWTEEELDLLKERLVEIIKENPRIKKIRAIEEAQKILDSDRQRNHLLTVCSTEKVKLIWATAIKEVNLNSKLTSIPKPVPVTEVVYVPVPTPLNLSTIPTHELLAAAILRILCPTQSLLQAPVTTDTPSYPEPVDRSTTYPLIPKPRIPKFGVVGLMKDQFNHLKARVNQSVVNLVWIDKDHGNNKFPESLDYVIVQKHSSHNHYHNAKNVVGSDRVIFVDGGITQCADKLKEKYPNCLN